MRKESKPIIESIINTTALALTSLGVHKLTISNDFNGYLLIGFGLLIEFAKYYGRKINLW